MKDCPACHRSMPDNAFVCPYCGGSWLPDGRFETSWDAEMARLAAERKRKVERAERFGRWGRPLPHFFLEGKSGCLVSVVLVVAVAVAAIAAALLLAEFE